MASENDLASVSYTDFKELWAATLSYFSTIDTARRALRYRGKPGTPYEGQNLAAAAVVVTPGSDTLTMFTFDTQESDLMPDFEVRLEADGLQAVMRLSGWHSEPELVPVSANTITKLYEKLCAYCIQKVVSRHGS